MDRTDAPAPAPARALVLDTNVALDLLVFEDPSTRALRAALARHTLAWLVLPQMRAEFARVLDYPHVATWRTARSRSAAHALAAFDALARTAPPVGPALVRCRDPDDQPFIDLAVAHQALLLSKDRDVLATRTALARWSVQVSQQFLTNSHPAGAQD